MAQSVVIETAIRRHGTRLRFLRDHWTLAIGAAILVVIALAALLAPLVAPHDPLQMTPAARLRPPSLDHLFGTDHLGRDVFSRTIWGGRVSLVVGLGVAALSCACGLVLGIFAGFFRAIDAIVMRIMDAMMAIPAILLAIALVSINRPTPGILIVAIALPEIPRVARLVRAVVLTIREQTYVEAAIAVGTRPLRLLARHVLPNAIAPLIVQATFVCALAIIIEASLSFLGAGTPPEVPSWGNIIAGGRSYLRNAPWILLYPGLLLGLTVLSVNLLGDGLRDTLDPRLARRMR
jgi:peptide/nickel transport system permease protein